MRTRSSRRQLETFRTNAADEDHCRQVARPGRSRRPPARRHARLPTGCAKRSSRCSRAALATSRTCASPTCLRAAARWASKRCRAARPMRRSSRMIRRPAAVIRRNAEKLGAAVQMLGGSALALPSAEPFDLIFADPPYAPGSGSAVVAAVAQPDWLAPGGWLSVETSRRRSRRSRRLSKSTRAVRSAARGLRCLRRRLASRGVADFVDFGAEPAPNRSGRRLAGFLDRLAARLLRVAPLCW